MDEKTPLQSEAPPKAALAQQPSTNISTPPSPLPEKPSRRRKVLFICSIVVLVAAISAVSWQLGKHSTNKKTAVANTTKNVTVKSTTSTASTSQGLQLDPNKDYGNKYANGILPVGDGKYSTTSPKVGYVYACSSYAQSLSSTNAGAFARGPWFTDNNTEYNVNEKIHVQGSVMWQADYTNTINGSTRVITTNDLPSQPTGIFPIMTTDPAYAYDRNPNHIAAQDLTYDLSANPTYGNPNCMGGESGIMTTGIALFNAFDAGGRDAGAWEVQDNCDGHPDESEEYHYHTLSACIKDTSVHTVIGYALDGFPITGNEVSANNFLTTDDLDVCHGITSSINLDGKTVTMYHYVMTEDFPYSVSCFRGTAIQPPNLKQPSATT